MFLFCIILNWYNYISVLGIIIMICLCCTRNDNPLCQYCCGKVVKTTWIIQLKKINAKDDLSFIIPLAKLLNTFFWEDYFMKRKKVIFVVYYDDVNERIIVFLFSFVIKNRDQSSWFFYRLFHSFVCCSAKYIHLVYT